MKTGRKILVAITTVSGLLMLAGTATALGESMSNDAAKIAQEDSTVIVPDSLPPVPQSARIIRTTQSVPTIPVSCTDYLNRVDKVIQSVYDYENGIAPANGALSKGLGALVDGDADALNESRTELNNIQDDTTGPLQDIVSTHSDLVAARAACQKDLGR